MTESRGRFLKNISFSATAVIGFFLALELLFRLPFFPPKWHLLEKTGRQGNAQIYKTPDGRQVLVPKPRRIFRIAVLGSSAAHGHPFFGAGFPEQMQAILELTHPEQKYEVINLAQPGVSTLIGKPMLEQALVLKPDLILVYMGNNEQLTFSWVNSLEHPHIFEAGRFLVLNSRVIGAILLVQGQILARGAVPIMISKYFAAEGKGPRIWPLSRKVRARLVWLHNLEQMSKMAQKAGVPLVISTMAANRSEWPPIRSVYSARSTPQVRERCRKNREEIWELIEQKDPGRAREKADQTLKLDPEFALSWFYMGLIQKDMGLAQDAGNSFEKAVELSDFQQETSWADNRALLQFCREKKLACVDLNSHLDRISASGFAGFNFFMDHCHFNLEG